MIAAPALLLGVSATLSSPRPAVHFAYQRLKLGETVAKMIAIEGPPNVVSTDVGHVWTWEKNGDRIRLTTDDDGTVRMIDLLPARSDHLTLTLPAVAAKTIVFGTLEAGQADAHLSARADFSGVGTFPDSGAKADFRAYRLTPKQEAVLLFDDATKRLSEVFYGDREFLARSGLLPGAPESNLPHYSAPVLQHEGNADYPPTIKEGDAFLRVSVDKNGAVSDAVIFVTSGDPQLDRAALVSARHDIFTPASLDSTPVSAVVFLREEFRQLPAH